MTMPRFSDGFKREGVPEMMEHGFRCPAVNKSIRSLLVSFIFSAERHIK